MAKKLNILIIGSGGREHALAYKIAQSPILNKLYVAPGNAGSAQVAQNIALDITDHQAILAICKDQAIDLVVIGPDDVLAAGFADALKKNNILVFGPTRCAAQIESSKGYAKGVMKQAGVHTADYQQFDDFTKAKEYCENAKFPLVVKADGLALGKGVVICQNIHEATSALQNALQNHVFGNAGNKVIIEEYLEGAEISLHAISDGSTYKMFPSAQDHKPIGEGDTGPNTGGMGTIAPLSWYDMAQVESISKLAIEPTLKHLNNIGEVFTGCLYPSIMLQENDYGVIEYNARFGDPETQSYMRLLQSDLLEILLACATGKLASTDIQWSDEYACCVVLASGGYPGDYNKGEVITGIDEAEKLDDIVVFHAGTKHEGDQLVTNGGRVLGVTATGKTLDDSLAKAYAAVKKIHFNGMQYRTDIGARPAPEWPKVKR